jgi:predicted amidohydrolase
MTTLRVACVQLALVQEKTVDDFLSHIERLVAEAAEGSAKIVVFPEMASTGLLGSITDHAVTAITIADDYAAVLAPMFQQFSIAAAKWAKRYSLVVLAGSHNRRADDGSLRNTAILAHPDGRVEFQDKLHLTPQEIELDARGGDQLLVTKVEEFTVGVLICADIQYPELSRHLAGKGVDLVLCPSLTWNRRGVFRVRTGCSARAMENQFFVAMSPLVGESGLPEDAVLHALGTPLVTAPVDKTFGLNDGVFANYDGNGEGILYADLDLDLLTASRAKPETPGTLLQRPDLYRALRGEAL